MNPITTPAPDPLFQVYCRFIELALVARRARLAQEAAEEEAAEAGEEVETDKTETKKAPK